MCCLIRRAQISIVMSIFGHCLFGEQAHELKSGNCTVYKCFSSHFPLQKPPTWHCKARMVGRGKLLKEIRGERWFDSDWNMAVHELSCLSGHSVGGFQHLPRQFEWNFTSKECNIVPIELGGSTQEKKREHWGRLSRMLLTLHISQAFLSVRNRAITGLQVEL